MSTMTARIGRKGQVTIPAAIRQKLGLRPGHLLEFDEKARVLKARPTVDRAAAYALLGSKKKEMAGKTAVEWVEWFRGPVELPPKQNGTRRR